MKNRVSLFLDTMLSLFSSDRKVMMIAGIIVSMIVSLGTILALLFDFSVWISFGIAIFVFFFMVFLRDPLLFLLCIIPFRMALDFSGEFFLMRIADKVFLTPSQLIGMQVFLICIIFFLFFPKAKEAFRGLFPVWIFFLWAVVSIVFSVAPFETARDLIRIFDIFALTSIAFVVTKSFVDVKRILFAILLSSIIPICFGVWQFVTGSWFPNEPDNLNRIYGTFGHPNAFGMYLFALTVFSFIFFRLFAHSHRERVFALAVGIFSLTLMFLTLSRVSWVIFFFFFFALAVLKFRKLLIGMFFIPFFFFLTVPSVQDRTLELFRPSVDSSVLWRINIWNETISRTIVEDRVIFGFGFSTFSSVVGALESVEFGSLDAHNDFVRFFVEGGIIGLMMYLFWMGMFVLILFNLSRDVGRNEKDRELFLYLLIFFLAWILASFSDAVFKSTPIQWIFWIFLGAILGLDSKRKRIILDHRNSE